MTLALALALAITVHNCNSILKTMVGMKHLLQINDHDFEHYELPDKKIFVVYLQDDFRYERHDEMDYRSDD
jgi:hypothetical protein